MKLLTKEEILQAMDLQPEEIEVPEWGGSIRIRGVSLAERSAMLRMMRDPQSGEISDERAAVAAFVFGVEEPRFTEEDVEALMKKSAGVIERIAMRILQRSGFAPRITERLRRDF